MEVGIFHDVMFHISNVCLINKRANEESTLVLKAKINWIINKKQVISLSNLWIYTLVIY